MDFNPVAIVLVIVGILAVIIGIRGSNNAVFQTLTGHSTTGQATTPSNVQTIPNAPVPGSGLPVVSNNPTVA